MNKNDYHIYYYLLNMNLQIYYRYCEYIKKNRKLLDKYIYIYIF